MSGEDPTYREASPVDGQGRVAVSGAEGWFYLPFEHDEATGAHRVTLEHVEEGTKIGFAVPAFVEQGDELSEIARIVIRAQNRWRELEGVGG